MATKRLLRELDAYNRSPSTALTHLAPTTDDSLLHLRATLKGPVGTPYEHGLFDLRDGPPDVSPKSTGHQVLDAMRACERLAEDWRDLLGSAYFCGLDAGVRRREYVRGGTTASCYGRAAG